MRKLRFLFAWLFMLFAMPVFVAYGQDAVDNSNTPTNDTVDNNVKYAEVETVDLGLSVQWATCNLGAAAPWEYGDYFAWGEVEAKDTCNWSTYKWCRRSYDNQTKYNVDEHYGIVDGKTTLELTDDAAYVHWGGQWRMPTLDEVKELLDNTTSEWSTLNGVKGCKFTSKTNGNSIFLPAAGYRTDDEFRDAGLYGYYWSSTLFRDNPANAYNLVVSDTPYFYGYYRYNGRSVRPVRY